MRAVPAGAASCAGPAAEPWVPGRGAGLGSASARGAGPRSRLQGAAAALKRAAERAGAQCPAPASRVPRLAMTISAGGRPRPHMPCLAKVSAGAARGCGTCPWRGLLPGGRRGRGSGTRERAPPDPPQPPGVDGAACPGFAPLRPGEAGPWPTQRCPSPPDLGSRPSVEGAPGGAQPGPRDHREEQPPLGRALPRAGAGGGCALGPGGLWLALAAA